MFIETNAVGSHRPGDVFDFPFAHVFEEEIKLVADLVANNSANAYAAGLRQGFEAGGYVYAITVNVLIVDDDVADVQADAKLDLPVSRNRRIA